MKKSTTMYFEFFGINGSSCAELEAKIEMALVNGEKCVKVNYGNFEYLKEFYIKRNDLIDLMFEALCEENGG